MKIIDRIKAKILKKNPYRFPYHDLAPVDDISEESEYFNALDWALHNKKISNIALSAPYGAGKSSVIESYLKNRKLKALQLSLANFNEEEENLEPEEVEKEFLKKLFYKVEYTKIPQSRYRKLHKISLGKIYACLFSLFVICYCFAVAFNYSGIKTIFDTLENTRVSLNIPPIIGSVEMLLLCAIALLVVSIALKWTFSKWKNWEISVFDKAKVSTDDDPEKSIFNRYIDEIVYFFEETKYEVVFIEDLDRFTETGIFTKLRELNLLLNRYDSIKRHITFVYAIKDDYFPSDTDRTKFFDFIIPVIPYINNTNSDDLLRRRIAEIKNYGVRVEISDEYITKVSSYIGDMRVLNSIVNEFVTYKKIVKKDDSLSLIDEELLSLMIFKNIHPKDFADIESEKGVIKEAFRCKDSFISQRIDELEKEIADDEQFIYIHENDILKDAQEIKYALMQTIIPNTRITYITAHKTNNKYSYEQIMDPDFNLTVFANTSISIQSMQQNVLQPSKEVADIEKEYSKNGVSFIERWEAAYKCEGEKKEQLRKNIEKKKTEIYKLKATRIQKLIEDYGAEELFNDNPDILGNQLLIFMLRNGYIDENYVNYINYYHPDSITPAEHEFILNLRNYGGVKDFSQELAHPDRVADRLVAHEFRQIEVLNFALVRHLLDSKPDSHKMDELLTLLSSGKKETKDFIQRYIQNEPDTVPVFIEKVSECNSCVWKDIESDEGMPDETKVHYFDLIIKYASIEAITKMEAIDNSITSYVLSRRGILTEFMECSTDKIIEVIDALGIKFVDVAFEAADEKLLKHIHDSNAYEINPVMIGEVIQYISPESYEQSKNQNYTIITTMDDESLQEYVDQNIEIYIKMIVLSEDDCNESQEAIEELIELVDYDTQISKEIINSQNSVFESIDQITSSIDENNKDKIHEIVDYLLEQGKIHINWDCISDYYGVFGITDNIFDEICSNINSLCEEDTDVDETFAKELLVQKWPPEALKRFVETYEIGAFDIPLTDFDEDRLRVLIDVQYIPFSLENIENICSSYPGLIVFFYEKYKKEILDVLDSIPTDQIPFDGIMKSGEYSDEERLVVLKKCDSTAITNDIATFIMNHEGGVDKAYVLAAWDILADDKKYELLVNHLDVLENKDLPALFNQLAPVYHELAVRANHKVSFDKTDYNERLLYKLKQKQYVTSVGTEEVDDESKKHFFSNEKKTVLYCRVKEIKTNTVKAN